MPNRHGFVSSRDIPDHLAEPVAYTAHRRGCGSFNGTKPVPAPKFEGTHRAADILYARIHIADLCGALHVTPAQLTTLAGLAVTTSQPQPRIKIMTAALDPMESGNDSQPQESRRCLAKNREGQPCQRWSIRGGTRCTNHGGGSPQARRKAAENLLQIQLLKLVPDPDDRAPITDHIEELFQLAEEIKAVKDTLAVMVNDLADIGYRGGLQYDEDGRLVGVGTEQTRAEFTAYERSLERLGKMLVDIAKLDLDTRRLKITEWHNGQVMGATLLVLTSVLTSLGLSIDDQQVRGLVVEQLKALPPVIEA
jgi:hypothetical protein